MIEAHDSNDSNGSTNVVNKKYIDEGTWEVEIAGYVKIKFKYM